MKNKLIRKMYIILVISVIVVAASVYSITYFMSQNAMMEDIQTRATGVRDFIIENLSATDFVGIGEEGEAGRQTTERVQEIFDMVRGLGNLERLYLAKINPHGEIVTTKQDGYAPTGLVERDLLRSLETGEAVIGSGIYTSEDGYGIYTLFWPVSGENGDFLGVVCMEFDVDILYQSNRIAAIYSLAFSSVLIMLFSVIAYLSMTKASEPFYKKLAYTDVLTGHENRMAFEHRMRECSVLAERGESITMIVCDVNNLKVVNDVQGHKAGDAYLKITADIICEHLPKGSPFYRIGGDEFATIMVGLKEHEIKSIMLALDNETRMTVKDQPFSCACGEAVYDPSIDDEEGGLKNTFKRADEVMYEVKKRQKAARGQIPR
ncbi:MAG: diguanylate cyclase [Oscillospiraceae bacterium]|nr:diguanylate cyclase [Oscillospiraceae bacterium]